MAAVTFGSFNLNDNVNYFVVSKTISTVAVVPAMYKISRIAGMKKTGETINERQMTIDVRVLGTSRSDLENKIDALQQALNLRNQKLTMRTNDSRYFYADCLKAEGDLAPGKVLSTVLRLSFVCYQPFAYANSASTVDTGTIAMTFSSGQIYTLSQNVTGGGSVYNYPTIRVYQRTVACSTTLAAGLTNGTVYTSLSVAALPVALSTRDTLIIGTQSVTVSSNASSGATTVNDTSFTANATYAIGVAVNRDASMTQIQVAQTTDGSNLYITSNLPVVAGDYIDINCDPLLGWTAKLNGGATLSIWNGLFPVIEPTSTAFTLAITCNSNPSVQVVWTYTSSWLS